MKISDEDKIALNELSKQLDLYSSLQPYKLLEKSVQVEILQIMIKAFNIILKYKE